MSIANTCCREVAIKLPDGRQKTFRSSPVTSETSLPSIYSLWQSPHRIFHRAKQCWKFSSVSLLRISVGFALMDFTLSNFATFGSDLTFGNKQEYDGLIRWIILQRMMSFSKNAIAEKNCTRWRIYLVKDRGFLMLNFSCNIAGKVPLLVSVNSASVRILTLGSNDHFV